MIEIARDRTVEHPAAARIKFREGPAEELPVDDDSADLIPAFDSCDHCGAKRAASAMSGAFFGYPAASSSSRMMASPAPKPGAPSSTI